jgi:hypothetical protein
VPSAIGVMFVLYILVSIVTGIVSSVIKKSQTTARRPRPVYVPGRQIPYPAELDLHDLEERVGPATADGRPDGVGTATEEHLAQTDVSDYYSGSTKLEDHSGSAVVDRPSHTRTIRGIRSTSEGRTQHESLELEKEPALPARLLSGDREQLRAVIVAVEVLGKPKGLTM